MKFLDEATIEVKSGHGGSGARHWRREKFVPMGGPDGGDGGKGGDVVLIASRNKHTLLDFQFNPIWKAADGEPGMGRNKAGRDGADLEIYLPVGTQIYADGTDELLIDLAEDGRRYILAKGGRGGRGNAFFKSPTNRAPEHYQPGEEGQSGFFKLSLKLVADVGLIGFPNAGKSTLISRISKARPKIADYPFTTLTPNLGVAAAKGGRNFVVADIPGLIPGASEGKGLGIKFLKHVERTKVLVHLIDPNQLDEDGKPITPLQSFKAINDELKGFSEELGERPQLVVLTKLDTITDTDRKLLDKTTKQFKKMGCDCLSISSASGEGIDELVEKLASLVHPAAHEIAA